MGVEELLDAAMEGDVSAILGEVMNGTDLNYQSEEGETALYTALAAGKSEAAHLLILHGADITMHDNVYSFLLHPTTSVRNTTSYIM